MPKPIFLELTDSQQRELAHMRDQHPKPYLRERAAALLKIAAGTSGRETARERLLKPHWPDTIYTWVKRYQADGLKGLQIKAGRGRKPAFFP